MSFNHALRVHLPPEVLAVDVLNMGQEGVNVSACPWCGTPLDAP